MSRSGFSRETIAHKCAPTETLKYRGHEYCRADGGRVVVEDAIVIKDALPHLFPVFHILTVPKYHFYRTPLKWESAQYADQF